METKLTPEQARQFLAKLPRGALAELESEIPDPVERAGTLIDALGTGVLTPEQSRIVERAAEGLTAGADPDPLAEHAAQNQARYSQFPEPLPTSISIDLGRPPQPANRLDLGQLRRRAQSEMPGGDW